MQKAFFPPSKAILSGLWTTMLQNENQIQILNNWRLNHCAKGELFLLYCVWIIAAIAIKSIDFAY